MVSCCVDQMKYLLLLLSLSANAANVKFKWDMHKVGTAVPTGYRMYISQTPGVYTDADMVGTSTTNTVEVTSLLPGVHYNAAVSAYNDVGESSKSDDVKFILPYVTSNYDFTLTMNTSKPTTFGVSFSGPPNLFEANGVKLLLTTNLICWIPMEIPFSYANGMYSMEMPRIGPKAFFKLEYTK